MGQFTDWLRQAIEHSFGPDHPALVNERANRELDQAQAHPATWAHECDYTDLGGEA